MKQFAALVADEAGEAVSIHQYTMQMPLADIRTGVLTLIKGKINTQNRLTSQVDKIFKLAFAPLDVEALKDDSHRCHVRCCA